MFNIGKYKFFLIFLFLFLFLQNSFSNSFYTSNNGIKDIFYTNIEKPKFNISLVGTDENLLINHSKILIDSTQKKLFSHNIKVSPFQKINLKYKIEDFKINSLEENNIYIFDLFILNKNNNRVEIEDGDPDRFQIIYDKTKPILQTQKIIIDEDNSFELEFNEKIKKISIYDESKNLLSQKINSNNLDTIRKNIRFNNFIFEENFKNVIIEFEDLAGNIDTVNHQILKDSVELEIELITKKENPKKKYSFDKNNPELFKIGDIYHIFTDSKDKIELEIKTSIESICYINSGLNQFKKFSSVDSKKEMSNEDKLIHKVEINNINRQDFIWIACKDINFGKIKYLSHEINIKDNLFKIAILENNQRDFNIDFFSPNKNINYNHFPIFSKTNYPATCFYNYDNSIYKKLNPIDDSFKIFKTAYTFDVNENVEKNLKIKCRDRLDITDEKETNFKYDPNFGLRIINFKPKETDKTKNKIEFQISKRVSSCKYNYLNPVTSTSYKDLSNTQKIFDTYSFNTTGLNVGDNHFYIYCELTKGSNEIEETKLILKYSNLPPEISNLRFLNDKGKEINISNNQKYISYSLNVNSPIKIKNYEIEIINEKGETTNINSSSKNKKVDISKINNPKKFRIRAIDIFNRASRYLEKNMKFDFEKPKLEISVNENIIGIKCTDSSKCQKIYYGTSNIYSKCAALLNYNNSDKPNSLNYPFVCARGIDFAGNENFIIKNVTPLFEIKNQTINTTPFVSNPTNITKKIEEPQEESSNIKDIDKEFEKGFEEEESSNLIYYIIFTLLGLSIIAGGGYYFYQKNKKENEDTSNIISNNILEVEENINRRRKKTNRKNRESFLDDILNKGTNVFNSFKKDKTFNLTKTKEDNELENELVNNLEKEKNNFRKFHKNKIFKK